MYRVLWQIASTGNETFIR